ncbi:hypothetical protein ACFYPT_42270 [Streptomyces sp. NPDC005529]|uniref:hypothetical protein n=1 Tax=unclassified Streptomyces TaxID=2593676 RepID=UPI0033AC6F49
MSHRQRQRHVEPAAHLPRWAAIAGHRLLAPLVALVIAAVVLLGGAGLTRSAPAATSRAVAASPVPRTGPSPHQCRVGAYITDLSAIDFGRRTVDADMWLWSICPDKTSDATRHFELLNATETKTGNRSSVRIGSSLWSQVKVFGTFRQNLDPRRYPFDRQTIVVAIEDDTYDAAQFTYAADLGNSGIEPGIRLQSYKVDGFSVHTGQHTYKTNFGDPRRSAGDSTYSRLVVQVRLSRSDLSGFIRHTWPPYVAFLATLIVYFLRSHDMLAVNAGRMGILGACLFSVLVSMQSETQALGVPFGITLIDSIHLLTLAYVLAGIAVTTYLVRNAGNLDIGNKVRKRSNLMAACATGTYLAANCLVLTHAASW